MKTRQRIIAVFFLIMGLGLVGCGPTPALQPPPTTIPLAPNPTSTPTVTQVSIPTDTVTPPPTPTLFVTEAYVSPEVEGTYTVNGIIPDGKVYSGKLTITLSPHNSSSSTKQVIYNLSWDNGSKGAGILIKDALATSFLATSFGGSTCSAVFYSAFFYMEGDTTTFTLNGTWLKLGTLEIGSEVATPIVPRPYLEGDYNVVGTNANGSDYKGTLSITQHNPHVSVWQLAWNIGQLYTGTGISLNKSLFAAAYGGEGCGVSVYKVNIDGSLHATRAVWGGDQVGEETATK
jgi:hypothetical protein